MTCNTAVPTSTRKLRKINLEVTSRCLLNCGHCSSYSHSKRTQEISLDRCLSIIEQAASMGVSAITLTGGEPLLHSGICDIAQGAIGKGLSVKIYTSGFTENSAFLLASLADYGVREFVMSVYSSDSALHDSVTRCIGSFSQTVKSIKIAVSLGVNVGIHVVPTTGNYQDVPNIVSMAKQLGVSEVSLLRLVPQGRAMKVDRSKLTASQSMELRNSILRLREQYGPFLRTGSPWSYLILENQPKCGAGLDRLTILPNLKIAPCDAFKRITDQQWVDSDDFSSLENSTLSECWEKSRLFQLVRNYQQRERPSVCRYCKHFPQCKSGCPAQKLIHQGNMMNKPDPDCLAKHI